MTHDASPSSPAADQPASQPADQKPEAPQPASQPAVQQPADQPEQKLEASQTAGQPQDQKPETAQPEPPRERRRPPVTERKRAANQANAQKSTGPTSEEGKARSRLNSLKHGILASQAVLGEVEGVEERRLFEEMTDGLCSDFHPLGMMEEMLVQQIAACMWRYRRMLQFENQAALDFMGDRTAELMSVQPLGRATAMYQKKGSHYPMALDEVLAASGLGGITLPGERALAAIVRYEGAITRTMHRALKSLEALQKRRGADASMEAAPEVASGAIDPGIKQRKAGHKMMVMPARKALNARARARWNYRPLEDGEDDEDGAHVGENKIDQTNPDAVKHAVDTAETITAMLRGDPPWGLKGPKGKGF